MGIEIKQVIANFGDEVEGARFIMETPSGDEIVRGVIDIPATGLFQFPMAGQGQLEGAEVTLHIDDYNGSNSGTMKHSYGFTNVVDDGFVQPPLGAEVKVNAYGDSMTAFSSSSDGATGLRPANEFIALNQEGYWVNMLNVYADGDYLVRNDLGVSGDTVGDILLRISTALAQDVDVTIFMAGHNDVSQFVDPVVTKANIDSILSNLLSSNIKVFICPIPHRRRDENFYVQFNLAIDDLNAHYALRASELTDVEIGSIPTDFNAEIINLAGITVSNDRLHPNNTGAAMLGRRWAPEFEALFPSAILKVNLLPDVFLGTGGVISSGATGLVPDGMRGQFANPTGDVGFAQSTSGGKNWVDVTTDGSAPVSNSNYAEFFNNPAVVATEGWYVSEVLVMVEDPDLLLEFRVELNSTTSTFNYTRFEALVAQGAGFEAGVPVRIRTPRARIGNDTVLTKLFFKQSQGANLKVHYTDFKTYKVEDV